MKVIIYGDRLFSVDLAWGFEELGHEAIPVHPASGQELSDLLSQTGPDLLITVGTPSIVRADALHVLGNRSDTKMKCAHWDTDGITWADLEMWQIYHQKPDFVFTVCPEMLERLKGMSIPCGRLDYAYSPKTHHPGDVSPEMAGQFAFVGSSYPTVISRFPEHYRRRSIDVLFKPLLDNGYRLDIYGDSTHWDIIYNLYHFKLPVDWLHGYIPYDQTSRVYRSSFINLVTQNHEETLTKRVFEILGSGGFILSYDTSAVRKAFTPGTDLVVTSSPEQTLEIINYYKKNPDDYKKVRENGLLSAQSHTYAKRAEVIISRVFGE